MKAIVVHLKYEKYDVRIDRATILGNPFTVQKYGRLGCIARYEKYARERMKKDAEFRRAVLACRGQRLGCWCAPKPCHGDVIIKLCEGVVR